MSRRNAASDLPALAAGILIGGAGARMGGPKQLLVIDGCSLLERVATPLVAALGEVNLVGGGPIPPAFANAPRIRDVDGVRGPVSGILAALRSRPGLAWLIAACDMPLITIDAVRWLVAQRCFEFAAVQPRLTKNQVEPLFAVYEPAAIVPLERLAAEAFAAPRDLARFARVHSPLVPSVLRRAWMNMNTPQDLLSWKPEDRTPETDG